MRGDGGRDLRRVVHDPHPLADILALPRDLGGRQLVQIDDVEPVCPQAVVDFEPARIHAICPSGSSRRMGALHAMYSMLPHIVRSTAVCTFDTSVRSLASKKNGSLSISSGEMNVFSRVRYGCASIIACAS